MLVRAPESAAATADEGTRPNSDPLRAGPSRPQRKLPATDLNAFHGLYDIVEFDPTQLNESEATRAPGVAVCDDTDGLNLPCVLEGLSQVVLCQPPR